MSEISKMFNHEVGCKGADYSECTCIDVLRAKFTALEVALTDLIDTATTYWSDAVGHPVVDDAKAALANYGGALAAHDARVRAEECEKVLAEHAAAVSLQRYLDGAKEADGDV